jgi:Ca-activated chloride channel homolog
MNHTSFRPSVLSRSNTRKTNRMARIGIPPGVILSALALAFVILASLFTVASASPASQRADPVGLFFKTDLTEDVFAAPTLSSDVVIEISGDIARVNVRQRFRNPSKVWMEGVYVFPLPEHSAADRLIMHVGKREIEGRILEKQEAEQVYREAAEAGHHASLLTSARPNVFSTSVANIGPSEEIIIEIEYQDRIRFDDDTYSYRFPLVVAPRYTPGRKPMLAVTPPEPRAGRWPELQSIDVTAEGPAVQRHMGQDIFGPVRKPDDMPANPVSLAVLLDSGVPLSDISSPNHDITVEWDSSSRAIIALSSGQVPTDQDFVLNWKPESGSTPAVGLFSEGIKGASHLVTTLLPPDRGDTGITERPRDIVFILDRSGSMHGTAIAQAKQAIRLAVARLPKDTRFNLIMFNNIAQPLFNGLRPAKEASVTRAFETLDRLESGGGTEMYPALDLAFNSERDADRLLQIVFLTDGAVSNEEELFRLINERLGDARLFTVGIGPAPNSFFMRRAAEAGRGTFTYIDEPRELDNKVSALLRKLERPAMTDLRVTWNISGDHVPQTHPARLPDLYFGEPISFASKLAHKQLEGTLTITGRRGEERWSTTIDLDQARRAAGVGAVWARAKIAELQAQRGQNAGEQDQIREQIIETALAYQLVTPFTSLVAVDENEIARPETEPLNQAEIARNLPDGMNFDKVFGARAVGPAGMAPVPQQALQSAAFRKNIGLPVTATPATQMAITGGLAMICALLLIVVLRRRAPNEPI